MNNRIKMDIITDLDNGILEKCLNLREKLMSGGREKPQKHFGRRQIIACIACIAIVLSVFSFVPVLRNIINTDNNYYRLDELTAKILTGSASRPGVLTPYPPLEECYEKEISKKNLEVLFQCSDFNIFNDDCNGFSGTILYYTSGTIHTVRLTWSFGSGTVVAIIDPVEYPHFILDDNDSTVIINGYTIGMAKYYENNVCDGIDIGLKNNSAGILLSEYGECESKLEKLFNFILNSNISFQALSKK